MHKVLGSASLPLTALLATISPITAHTGTADVEWPTYSSDLGHTCYTPQTGTPVTYAFGGVQQLVVAIKGSDGGEPVAFGLSEG